MKKDADVLQRFGLVSEQDVAALLGITIESLRNRPPKGIARFYGGRRRLFLAGSLAKVQPARTGIIYFVQGDDGTPVKVGFTGTRAGMTSRLQSLQNGNPYRLRVLTTAEGRIYHERAIQAALRERRLVGEWFEWCDRLEQLLGAIQRGVSIEVALGLTAEERAPANG